MMYKLATFVLFAVLVAVTAAVTAALTRRAFRGSWEGIDTAFVVEKVLFGCAIAIIILVVNTRKKSNP